MGWLELQIKEMLIKVNGKSYKSKLMFIQEKDRYKLKILFKSWKTLFIGLRSFGSRGVNMPEGISESAFALEMECPRVLSFEGAGASFDNFDYSPNNY